MGSNPSEYNGVNCSICGRRLPPCKDWSGFRLQTIDRLVRVDQVYVFLWGQYYRIKGRPSYYCPTDFWKPKIDYIQQQQQERLEEAERRREEMERIFREQQERLERARQAEEERRRLQIQRQLEEYRRRQREALEEKERQMALMLKEEETRQALESVAAETGEDRVTTDVQVMTSVYNPFLAGETSQVEVQAVQTRYNENIPDDATFLESETVQEIDTVTSDLVESVQFSITQLYEEGGELSGWWSKAAQTLLLTHYIQSNSFPTAEKDLLLDSLAILQTDLGDTDCLSLADSFSFLVNIRPIDIETTFTVEDSLPLTAKVATLLLQAAKHIKDTNLWMQRCLYTYVTANSDVDNGMMQKMYLEAFCKDWSGHNFLRFFNSCKELLPDEIHKKTLHLIKTYCVRPKVVMAALDSQPHNVLSVVKTAIKSEDHQSLVDIIYDIRASKLVKDNFFLNSIETIAVKVYELLGTFNLELDYDHNLQSSLTKSQTIFQSIGSLSVGVSFDDLAAAMVTLYCACQKFKGWSPRRTQLVSLLHLVFAGRNSFNLLLEIMTGEGKSVVVVLYAIILAHQNKHVDVVTSSPILAVRDVEEWEEVFQYFGVTVTHNTDLNRAEDADMDVVKTECYKKQVVYGTVGNFAGDILRQEFEQKKIREGRRSDAIIVDEVDMLMLDKGVQFTYLSHNAAILQHIEPVIAAVWGMIGPLNLTRTTEGEILYAGSPNLFTQAIYACLDPEISLVQSHEQILLVAQNLGIFTENQYTALLQDDQEAKKITISEFTIDQTLALISGLADYENMPEFKAYIINSEGALEAVTTVEDNSSAEKLLMLGNGLACILNTDDEIIDRGTEIMKTKINFSDTESDEAIRLPKHLQEFVANQLPVYVENALRALHMEEDREYAIMKGRIIPVDFQNSGVMELNKKWGGGLQQMLEMKHFLSMTPISLVTNFMSNVEFFSRYKREGGIYGMSGTLGLDKHSNTTAILKELYNTEVGSIPTFKLRKLFEEPSVIVESHEQWFKMIVDTVREESQEAASWKKGRASLILCEDIRTAEDLKTYFVETEHWPEDKVYLYAHSNSKQLSTIKKKLSPGEIIIATNLAGRGTNVKVTDDVNESGGLLCLVTFLARNRRVELQAFGRTARGGKPGSVRCILNYAAMPEHYYGMNIEEIRKMRAEEESIRLRDMLDHDVKEVETREKLFKEYCRFLGHVYTAMSSESDDQKIMIDSYNETWAQWLLMRSDKVERLLTENLLCELMTTTRYWNQAIISNLHDKSLFAKWQAKMQKGELPDWSPLLKIRPNLAVANIYAVANFYHCIQFGNQILTKEEDEKAYLSLRYYDKSIELEPRYSTIAHYNRAYATIISERDDNKKKARADIQAAIEGIDLYIGEVSSVSQCVAIVGQTKVFEEREADDYGEEAETADFNAQIQARFEILHFLREKMLEAIQKIDSISGDIIAKPVGIFSLLPDADHITSLELTRMWALGLEIVYTIEKKPRFFWEALIVFILGVAEIVGGVLLTVFTAGAAAQFGMGLIAEGISDCIAGIEGMITGEFSWADWAISKATSIALSLVTGGVSRLASSGLKAIKSGYKAAKQAGKTLKSIPKMVSSTTKNAAKANLKTAAKHVAKEAVMQGISYGTSKVLNIAVDEVTKLIGENLKKQFVGIIRTSFTSGYLEQVVDGRFIAELNVYYEQQSDVPAYMLTSGKNIFDNVGESVTNTFNTNSELKERLATTSMDLFAQLSEKSKKLKGIANFAQSAIVMAIVADTVASLEFLVEEFPTKMEDVTREFIRDQKIIMSSKSAYPYRGYRCATKLKNDLADHVGDVFAEAVAILLQEKLSPLVSSVSNRFNSLTQSVVGNYVLKADKTMEDLKSIQHANYIRAVGVDTGSGRVSNIRVAKVYAKKIASSDTPGSLMELRVAAEHYGQKVTIFTEKNGKLIKDTVINPSNKKTQDEIKLVYIPPPNPNSVGHYDVLINGVRKRVEADQSNCLFHAYAFSRKPDLTRSQLKQEAVWLRQTVVDDITNNPSKFAEHIRLRVDMDNLRRGNRFALIGAGPRDAGTKILDGFYKQEVKGDKIYTMYEQANGVKCKAWRKYNKNLTVDANGVVQEADARLTDFEVTMDNLNLATAAGKRCWDTKSVVGMIKRPGGNPKDTEVSYHLCPSRGGANAGDLYANAVPASIHYNNLEKYIWSKPMQKILGSNNFSMTVKGYCGKLGERLYEGKRDIDAPTKDLLSKRYALIEKAEPRAYRLQNPSSFIVKIPPTVTLTAKDIAEIRDATFEKDTDIGADANLADRTVTIIMPTDNELFIPTDLTLLKPNGELYPGELTTAKMKQPKLRVNRSSPYQVPATAPGKSALDKFHFANEFARFAV